MRSSFTPTTGLKLSRSPSVRDQANRRKLAVVAAILGLAASAALLGVVTAPQGSHEPAARTGPFSYFPSQ